MRKIKSMLHQLHLISYQNRLTALSVALLFFLSGCGGVAQGAALQPTSTPSAPAATNTPTAIGYAVLAPQPSGTATLTWDPAGNHALTVTLAVIGLAPAHPSSYQSAPYPAVIGMGTCQQRGSVVNDLTPVTADQYGAGTSTTAIQGVTGGIPTKGWFLALQSPGAANQRAVLACTNILNPTASPTSKQTVKMNLPGLTHDQGGQAALGKARLVLSGTTLTVTLTLDNLAPGSQHEAHIHAGTCAKQGPVVHPLPTVKADASGRAQVKAVIQNVQSIPGDWYIHVHNGAEVTTQMGYQPITCGDIFTGA